MSERIPRDPEELSLWLKRNTDLRSDIRKLLQGKELPFLTSLIAEIVSQAGSFTSVMMFESYLSYL